MVADWTRYFLALLVCAATTLLALPLLPVIDPTNIAMLFLLAVVLVAVRLGSGPAVLAAFASVALFDFFFVPPRLSWAVADVQYLITFAVMLVVALVIGQLAARLQERAQEAQRREARTQALYEMARELSGVLTAEQVEGTVKRFLAVQAGTAGGDKVATFVKEQQPLLDIVASLAAIAVERIHYVEVAQQATVRMESERLRAALLSAVSHDLRTPLTVLVGLADSLALARPPLPAAQADAAVALREQSLRLAGLVDNLLDMARLQVGRTRLRKEWQPLEEVVGASLLAMEPALRQRDVRVELAADLPLLEFDAVLIERVFCNLIENATKYAPQGEITVAAKRQGEFVEVAVCDRGPGVPEGSEEAIFDLFERGAHEGAGSGVGLGLAICRAIVEAHGGLIQATNRPEGGACFLFTLPLGRPPAMEAEQGG